MTTTLSEGVKVPDVGSVNWGADLEINWYLLNGALANLSANVRLNADNTWTGTQTFLLPIVGSITGTASRAIADEDGNSIKTSYGKLAGANTWTDTNTFRNINPETNSTYSLGTSSLKWSNIYSDNFYATNNYTIVAYTRNASDQPTVTAFIREFKVDSADGKSFSRYATTVDQTYTNTQLITILYDSNGDVDNEMRIRMQVSSSDKIFIPGTNGDVKLGTSSNRWSAVYADSYYYGTTAWGLDKANEWTNTNTFSAASYGEKIRFKNTGLDLSNGNPALSSTYQHILWWDDKNNTHYAKVHAWTSDTNSSILLTSYYRADANTVRTSTLRNQCDATSKSVFPDSNGDTDLGTSTNKWKTLNGINPGALSLPSDSGVAFNGDITNTTGTTNNPKTWTVNGWGYIRIPNSSTSDFISVVTSDTHEAYLATGTGSGNSNIGVSFPIVANRTYYIYVSTSGNVMAYYFPCLGNV